MIRIAIDPQRLDEVFVLADVTEQSERAQLLLEHLRSDAKLSGALVDKPRLGSVDLDTLSRLPEGTLGRAYADFMRSRGLAHEDLQLVEGEGELDFLRNHLRETHDLWHVATGFDTDVAGELGVQAFYLAQFTSPLPVMLIGVGMLNALVRDMDDAGRRVQAIARGWLLGRRAEPLFGLRWAERWDQPLEELRRERSIDVGAVDAWLSELDGAEALAAVA